MDFTKIIAEIGGAITRSGWLYGFEQLGTPLPSTRQLPAPPTNAGLPIPRRPQPARQRVAATTPERPAVNRPMPPVAVTPEAPVTGPVFNQCQFNITNTTTHDHRKVDRSDRRSVVVKLPRRDPRGGHYENQ